MAALKNEGNVRSSLSLRRKWKRMRKSHLMHFFCLCFQHKWWALGPQLPWVGRPWLWKLPDNPELVQDLLLYLDTYKSIGPDGIHPRDNPWELADVITRPLSITFLGSLERSQSTWSWQMLFQFLRKARRKTLVITGLPLLHQGLLKEDGEDYSGSYWKTLER